MAEYSAPLDDMRFNLYDVFDMPSLWAEMPGTAEVTVDLVDAVLDEGGKIAENLLFPLNRTGDEAGCSFADGEVTTPPGFKEAFREYAAGGWIGLIGDPQYGGQGLPKTLVVMFEEMLFGVNSAFALYPILTSGCALAIATHASEEQKQTYLPKLYSGEWAGAMCLTESGAGSDLGIMQTKATASDDGTYKITGTKIFITGGEQDITENIIHLVLAKLPDAPAGTRGISLFIVPKYLVKADGSLGERNAVNCGSVEHKMGIKGSATCVMNFDGATGYLVGELNRGLAGMFTMMNYERLSMGQQGLGLGEVAYQSAAAYAKERLQGRAAEGVKSPELKADSILVHPDVRRMLLTMRSLNEAGRSFAVYVARQLDTAKFHGDENRRQAADTMSQLLTPIAKAFMSDNGFNNCVLGQMVFGGHGYIREWGMEQLVRDARIAQIYEGTNGIQAIDLISRKILKDAGTGLALFLAEVNQLLGEAIISYPQLQTSIADLQETSAWLLRACKDDANLAGSVATSYLELFGTVAYGFCWAMMLEAAKTKSGEFAEAKRCTGAYFFAQILPQTTSLAAQIRRGGTELMTMPEHLF